jgi:uncharacterized membrane protein YkvA (DUF1232 family)
MIFKVGRLLKAANAARLTVYLIALWKLFKHPQTPRHAKLMAVMVLAYALSPIDLIPDFIPVLGQLDDLILVPLGIALVVKMTPKPLWEQLLREAEKSSERVPALRWGVAIIVVVWLLALALLVWGAVKLFGA